MAGLVLGAIPDPRPSYIARAASGSHWKQSAIQRLLGLAGGVLPTTPPVLTSILPMPLHLLRERRVEV